MSAQDDALQHIENLNDFYAAEGWDTYIDPDAVIDITNQIDGGWEYLANRLDERDRLSELYAQGMLGDEGQAYFEGRLVDEDGFDLYPAGIDYYHGTFG